MNKYIASVLLFVFLGIGTISAQDRNPRSQTEDTIKRPILSDLRKKNAVKYKQARARLSSQPKVRTKAAYRFRPCTPCDTRYVAQLLKKERLNKEEIRHMICTNQPRCKANAEFREMYNELVHKVIDKAPDRFFDTYQERGQRQYLNELDEEILNPIDDRFTAETTLQKIKSRMRMKTNNQIDPIMLRRLEGKLERKIQLRKTELIKRKAIILQGGN